MSEIKPAMTAEEWERVEVTDTSIGLRVPDDYELPEDVDKAFELFVTRGTHEHRTAALCLYEQPFGFTREDVDLLRTVVREASHREVGSDEKDAMHDIADRIEALLPPQEQN